MPRSNREYLLRYAEQAINDLERALERLQMLSDAYAGNYRPLEGDVLPVLREVPEGYTGQHAKYQQYVDLVAAQVMQGREDLVTFKKNFM